MPRGGSRKGAGRKSKDSKPDQLSVRIEPELKKLLEKKVSRLSSETNKYISVNKYIKDLILDDNHINKFVRYDSIDNPDEFKIVKKKESFSDNQNSCWHYSRANDIRNSKVWFLSCLQKLYEIGEMVANEHFDHDANDEYGQIAEESIVIDVLVNLQSINCLLKSHEIYELIKYQWDVKNKKVDLELTKTDLEDKQKLVNYLNTFVQRLERKANLEINKIWMMF